MLLAFTQLLIVPGDAHSFPAHPNLTCVKWDASHPFNSVVSLNGRGSHEKSDLTFRIEPNIGWDVMSNRLEQTLSWTHTGNKWLLVGFVLFFNSHYHQCSLPHHVTPHCILRHLRFSSVRLFPFTNFHTPTVCQHQPINRETSLSTACLLYAQMLLCIGLPAHFPLFEPCLSLCCFSCCLCFSICCSYWIGVGFKGPFNRYSYV